jgi:hypothetical protein
MRNEIRKQQGRRGKSVDQEGSETNRGRRTNLLLRGIGGLRNHGEKQLSVTERVVHAAGKRARREPATVAQGGPTTGQRIGSIFSKFLDFLVVKNVWAR